ncbi:TonB-dependent receptor [Pelomonas sp. SE-A7]|uniref:TonB-dependent receptor n=1 Tax=Pelomonas sp. SE-A7 TaxID=3054953 RepID=UPI00259CA775|nr:TonB-dependent receptor [Pelomonas sp. SE-A7]MDM4766132.1 TonB-dependent receptor [Pelomonas sp. SE-A7]
MPINFSGNLRLHRTAVALAVCLAAATATQVQAQSNATGSIFGSVQATPGTTVLIENPATGFKRTVTPDATGRIQASSLPVGSYKVSLLRDGKAIQTREGVEVQLGQGAEVSFGQQLETVTVTGARRKLDVSSADNGASFSAKQLEALPTGRNLDAIIRLAPNTTNVDPRYPGGASIGGGAASENSYYINGFPVTNPLNQLGSSELPFGAIEQAQILNGGFGAEFGRSVGGVINVITKSGTNTWETGGTISLSPNSLRSKAQNRYYATTGKVPATDGKLFLYRENNTQSETQVGGYVGGPLIKDHLFMFVAAEKRTLKNGSMDAINGSTVNGADAPSAWNDDKTVTTRVLGKLDFNITDGHRLDLTLIGDTPKLTRTVSGANTLTGARNGKVDHIENWKNDEDGLTTSGANVQILRYVGELSDNLTLTALYGKSSTKRSATTAGIDTTVPFVGFENGNAAKAPGLSYPVLNSFTGQLYRAGNEDKVKGLRLDIEYKLGQHTLRAGMDDNKMSTLFGGKEAPPGGRSLQYRLLTDPAAVANKNLTLPDSGSQQMWIGNPNNGALAAKGYYGVENITSSVSDAYSNQTAQYIEDKYQVTKNLLLVAGLRRETYENQNSAKETFLKVDNQYNPRFQAVWDALGDSSLKVFTSAGRYSIQIPTLVALRGANGSTGTSTVFTYTGVDSKGMPTGRIDQTKAYSPNAEYGQAKDPHSVAGVNMKPAYQDEMTVGIEKALTRDLNGGVKLTYRSLKSTIDDMCDWRPFAKWLEKNPGVSAAPWKAFLADVENGHSPFSCASFNPGEANSFDINFNGDGKTYTRVNLSAADLGYGGMKPKRVYTALDFFVEHPFRDNWYGKVTYTYSTSKGNTEGQTLSDRAQRDVSATQTWDQPELMEHAYGYLPNDRKHQIKGYGYVQLTPEWQAAGALSWESGRPRSCLGVYKGPNQNDVNWGTLNYGSNYHYCFGKPADRGAVGRLANNSRIDLSLTYKPSYVPGLSVSAEVFNVANSQAILAVEERGETGSGAPRSIYELSQGNAAPRNVRFAVTYNKAF